MNSDMTHRRNSRKFFAKSNSFTKFLCALLIVSLFSISTPAAPQLIVGKIRESSQDFRFAFFSSRLAMGLPNWLASFLSISGNSSVASTANRIEIFPGSVTVQQGERITFSAVGFDAEDAPISAIGFTWHAADTGRGLAPRPLNDGIFEANIIGTFTITAQGGGQHAQVTATVLPSVAGSPTQPNFRELAPISISSRSIRNPKDGKQESSDEKEKDKELPANSQNLNQGEGIWNNDNWNSSDDPGNLPGNPPGSPADDGAGNGNFQLSAPVISLPGRGIDLALNLNYNSRVWNKAGNELTFDIDRGFPAPGWSLGFERSWIWDRTAAVC